MATAHSERTKAMVLAEIAAGGSVRGVAKKHGISPGTVRGWRAQAGLDPARVSPQNRADLGEQLYTYLEESLVTLVAQLRFARDPQWLARQNAADLAVFMGVAADKATRLLAAFRPAERDEPPVIDIPGSGEG